MKRYDLILIQLNESSNHSFLLSISTLLKKTSILIVRIKHIFILSNSIKAKFRFVDIVALTITIKNVLNVI